MFVAWHFPRFSPILYNASGPLRVFESILRRQNLQNFTSADGQKLLRNVSSAKFYSFFLLGFFVLQPMTASQMDASTRWFVKWHTDSPPPHENALPR